MNFTYNNLKINLTFHNYEKKKSTNPSIFIYLFLQNFKILMTSQYHTNNEIE